MYLYLHVYSSVLKHFKPIEYMKHLTHLNILKLSSGKRAFDQEKSKIHEKRKENTLLNKKKARFKKKRKKLVIKISSTLSTKKKKQVFLQIPVCRNKSGNPTDIWTAALDDVQRSEYWFCLQRWQGAEEGMLQYLELLP